MKKLQTDCNHCDCYKKILKAQREGIKKTNAKYTREMRIKAWEKRRANKE